MIYLFVLHNFLQEIFLQEIFLITDYHSLHLKYIKQKFE